MQIPDIGVFAVIDLENHMFDAIEVFVASKDVRTAMGRAPDVDEPQMISWGRVARAEIYRVIAYTEEEYREEVRSELDEFLSNLDGCVWTLYFADPWHRE